MSPDLIRDRSGHDQATGLGTSGLGSGADHAMVAAMGRHCRMILSVPLILAGMLAGCATGDREHKVLISIPEQKMLVTRKDVPVAVYPVSTSKYGVGDSDGSYATPLGNLEVARKIGGDAPAGMKFKDRRPTGEIVPVDAPGRDPIVSRILWLRGLEPQNRNAYGRFIYIHGTAEERNVGRPVSFGCIRMRSRDVIRLYDTVGIGARVQIINAPLPQPPPPPPPRQALQPAPWVEG